MIVQEILTPLREVNPNTVEGSFHRSLLLAKTWMISELEQIKTDFDTIYVLGSWYGNMSLLLAASQIHYRKIINVEMDQSVLDQSQRMINQLGLGDKITPMLADANSLDYHQLGSNGLVINTSCNNIDGVAWLDHIPAGTYVALQGRNRDPAATNQYDSFNNFDLALPIAHTMYQDQIILQDPETEYECYMKIGTV